MYADKLVTAIKAGGKVLREHKDTVYVPFGTEYSLLIKNKNSVRALVKVEIDGVDATEGTQLIVPANSSIDLERFIKEGNFDKGHKFKFIERTSRIENHRGIGAEDGLIRVEFEFERQPAQIINHPVHHYDHHYHPWPYAQKLGGSPYYGDILCSATIGDASGGSATATTATNSSYSVTGTNATGTPRSKGTEVSRAFANQAVAQALNDFGITVPGSVSEQKFEVGAWFPTDGQKHVMILKLLGQVGQKPVEKPITVKMKKECPTCGAGNKHGSKFCRECGTALTIL